ncbi:MAG: CsgG/HfaB family protein, partial [Pseudomonadota bacterium]
AKDDEPAIPSCAEPYGSVALKEPSGGGGWWQSYDLENPEALIKYYVNESGCFTLVDRGAGLEMSRNERELSEYGDLQPGANIGGGQLVAADFFLIPDLVADDDDTGGKAIGGALGGRIGGSLGGIVGGIKTKNLEADTVLTLVNTRTGVQTVTARGQAKKRDLSLGVGGLLGVGAGIGSYKDTEIGRVIATAYAKAYSDLVSKVQSSGGALADAGAPTQSYIIALDTDMYAQAARGDTVRGLREGMSVYPTGNRDGAFLEVTDKFGTTGWVSVEDLQ